MKTDPRTRSLFVVTAWGLATLGTAHADSDWLLPRSIPPAYTQECASCHTAYPPGLLPARSWQRIMAGLDKHYGTDASADAAMVRELGAWLQANAASSSRRAEEPPQDRITRSAWFVRKHRKVGPAVWTHASVKSAANCAACHAGADRGDFDDDGLRVPAGLDARYRRAWHD
jgi:hypothetical protein